MDRDTGHVENIAFILDGLMTGNVVQYYYGYQEQDCLCLMVLD